LNYIDLFHGIGGFALGAYWAGMKFDNHFCSDIEPYAQKLYKLRFPESIQLGDITKIDTEVLKQYGNKWIITGGFPCQDISIAGKGKGIHGERSGLWFEYWRLINDLRPDFAIMENVGMLIHRGLREVLGSLAEIGYNAEWQDIRASDIDAPHKRERIWIVAYADSNKCGEQIRRKNESKTSEKIKHRPDDNSTGEFSRTNSIKLYDKRCQSEDVADTGLQRQTEYEEQTAGIEQCGENVSDYHGQRLKEQYNGITERPGDINGCDVGRKTEHAGWSAEPAVGRLVNGLPGRVDRLKGLGNSIVPQIAELLFNQIKSVATGEPRKAS
jgi:DNA (cytosine-5)-methyltransferase 1